MFFEDIIDDNNNTIGALAVRFFNKYSMDEIEKLPEIIKSSCMIFKKMAECERYKNLRLINYVTDFQPDVAKQFADFYGRNTIDDFRNRVLAKPLPNIVRDETIDISYSPISVSGASAYTEEKQLEAIAYYLKHNTGLKEVEQNVLNRNSHGSTC